MMPLAAQTQRVRPRSLLPGSTQGGARHNGAVIQARRGLTAGCWLMSITLTMPPRTVGPF